MASRHLPRSASVDSSGPMCPLCGSEARREGCAWRCIAQGCLLEFVVHDPSRLDSRRGVGQDRRSKWAGPEAATPPAPVSRAAARPTETETTPESGRRAS